MKKKTRRMTALMLVITTFMSLFNSTTVVSAAENENDFGYVMYASSYEEDAISISASNICINGDLLTNGGVDVTGNFNHNGNKDTSENEPYFWMYNKINNVYFSGNYDTYIEDTKIEDMNLNMNTAMMVYGELYLQGNVNMNTSVQSMSSINISGNNLNANNAVIMSKYNDINISSENVSITGLIYAPFGEVSINANNCNLNNVVIIASKVNIQCGNLNANYNANIGKIIGNDGEANEIPVTDWKYIKDTDGDGLNDYYEMYYTYTDMLNVDTDNDNVTDFDDDEDEDMLSNGEELTYLTDPLVEDSDEDSIVDGEELKLYKSNPLDDDTDDDGLIDGDEIILKTDMFIVDTDGDGISDSEERCSQEYELEMKNSVINKVSVKMDCTGNISRTTSIEDMLNIDSMSSGVVGLVGSPFEITTESKFDTATISFKIDENFLDDISMEDLIILWYDEANREFVAMDTEYDFENQCLSTKTTHFSQYMVVDKEKWFDAWMYEIDYYSHGEDKTVQNNTVIVLDCSGSMSSYDRITYKDGSNTCYRIMASENFISARGLKDKISIITFADAANVLMSMSNNRTQLKDSLQNLYDYGGTNFNEALLTAIDEFDNEKLYADSTNNRIIFMSDGIATCSEAYLAEAKSKGIVVHTVGLGNSSGDVVLKRMAEATGGTFMKAVDAEELVEIFTEFGLGEMDKTDSDGDGLYDVIETAGIRLENGQRIYTDPLKEDSDGDGLLDGEEIETTPFKIPMRMIGFIIGIMGDCEYSEVGQYYFYMYSDPNCVDTDGDGYSDFDEVEKYGSRPRKSDLKEYDLDENYVNIKYDGGVSYGSDQGWLYDENTQTGYLDIEKHGCGLIAFSDVLTYVTTISDDFGKAFTNLEYNPNGTITYDSYIRYVVRMFDTYVDLDEHGIEMTELKNSFNKCFNRHNFGLKAKRIVKEKDMYDAVEDSIRDDYPVVLRISHTVFSWEEDDDHSDEVISLYTRDETTFVEQSEEVGEHFVVVTGVVKDKITQKVWLKISSWGTCYYIDYDEYIDYKTSDWKRDKACDIVCIGEK